MENKNHFWISNSRQENQKSDYEMGLIPLLINYFIIIIEIVNFRYMEKNFDQKEYIKEYNKTNYKQFKAELPKEKKEQIDIFLKENNLSKAEFIRINYMLSVLKKEVKEIIQKYHINNEFSLPPNLSNGKENKLNNGIVVYSYTFPVLNDDKMLVLRIEFNNETLYYGVANYNHSPQILKEIEKIDTSF